MKEGGDAVLRCNEVPMPCGAFDPHDENAFLRERLERLEEEGFIDSSITDRISELEASRALMFVQELIFLRKEVRRQERSRWKRLQVYLPIFSIKEIGELYVHLDLI